jgi:hypothetical protein
MWHKPIEEHIKMKEMEASPVNTPRLKLNRNPKFRRTIFSTRMRCESFFRTRERDGRELACDEEVKRVRKRERLPLLRPGKVAMAAGCCNAVRQQERGTRRLRPPSSIGH